MSDEDGRDQLETDQVFIDTQVWVKERLNWNSKSCNRLRELVRTRHVQVLTTSVTRSEVHSKIEEALQNARGAMDKHDVVLRQLNCASAMEALEAPDASAMLHERFDAYMQSLNAVDVPLSKDVSQVFDAYFNARPPFSAKKKSEFPDAFVALSLQERARTIGRQIYVVSGDADLKACCARISELIAVDNLSEVISRATVTKAIHDSILSFMQRNQQLEAKLIACLERADIAVRGLARVDGRVSIASSEVQSVDQVAIANLNVITRQGDKFTCDVEFEAILNIWLDVDVERVVYYGDDDYEETNNFSSIVPHVGLYTAEVDVRFDNGAPERSEIEFVQCEVEIEIDAVEIDELRRHR
ncbi:PIN domain-containing protein [Bradyrhizobium roseum]|uniref:PIN domain-containing protein n=1 Tax=Bradyrhizobium roseum TaxID=3056648 RepID=UPI00260901D8|nr:PIN domain-containing protein [Bradyrhizobium roseus]WKA27824.1 PIN domain-containing protein [Bradyrhizobium roseus]